MSEEKIEDVVVECTKEGETCTGEEAASCPFKCDKECCPEINPVEPPPDEGPPPDPTGEFDITRKDRMDTLSAVNETLKKLAEGQKLNSKRTIDMIKKLSAHAVLLDELVVTLLQEMYRIVQAIANQEVSDFSLRASMDALASALIDKGLITKVELQDSFNNIIKKSFPAPEAEEGVDDVEDAEVVAEYVAEEKPVEAEEPKPEEG
jgi:hypothetical protein